MHIENNMNVTNWLLNEDPLGFPIYQQYECFTYLMTN